MIHDPSRQTRGEDGAILVLVLIFVVALAIALVAMATLATNSLENTVNFRQQRTAIADAENEVTISAQYLRTNYYSVGFYDLASQPCPGITGVTLPISDPHLSGSAAITLLCTATTTPNTASTRTVDFYAYLSSSSSAATCYGGGSCATGTLVLHAEVIYDDIPVSQVPLCGPQPPNGTISSATCGEAMTVSTWDQALAD